MALFRRIVNIALAPKTEGAAGGLLAVESGLGVELSNLDCVFHVKKNTKPQEPNTAELKIYNLSKSTRALLSSPKKLVLRLEAGYEGRVAQLFLGEVRSAFSTREGAGIVSEVSTGDSEKELQTARIALSIGPKVPASTVLVAIARALKVGTGDLAKATALLQARGATFFGPGSAVVGEAAQAMTDICRSGDLDWWIDDGVLQIVDRGKALESQAVYLSPETGLIGSPTLDHKGVLSFTALIQPDLRPGRKVAIQSVEFNAFEGWKITQVEYTGDTRGTEWYAKCHAKKY